MTDKDIAQRELALVSTGKNIVVRAGAGTGKTTLLIDRLCFVILTQDVSIESIAVLTFTEKAAAEVKTRLILKLTQVIKEIDNPATDDRTVKLVLRFAGADEIKKRAEKAFNSLDYSQISTIHSFCSYILKKYPVEANVHPSLDIDAGQKRTEVFERHWYKWLDGELGLESVHKEKWKEILSLVSLDDIYEFAFLLCSGRIESYSPLSHADMIAHICDDNARLADDLLALQTKRRKIEEALSNASVTLRASAKMLRSRDFSAPADMPEVNAKVEMPKVGWDIADYEAAVNVLKFAASLHPSKLHVMMGVYDVLKDFVLRTKKDIEDHGIVSYDDLLVKTRALVRDNIRVRQELKKDFSYLFIDEFQDTDPVQGEMLLFLAEDFSSLAQKWQDLKLAPGKLFVVGDPKQSIYRFRGADIEAYESFTNLILKQGGVLSSLQTNFRSGKNIVDSVNHISSRIMKAETLKQPEYTDIYAGKGFAGNVNICYITPDESAGIEDMRVNQAEYIAEWIYKNVGKAKLESGETFKKKDIAILLRSRSSLSLYTEALKRYDIPYAIEEEKRFYYAQEIKDLFNLLSVLDNPYNKIAMFGVLRSPFGGMKDKDILDLSRAGLLNYTSKPPENTKFNALNILYKNLRRFRALVGRVSIDALITTILKDTFFVELASLAYSGEETVANINYFVKEISSAGGEAGLSLSQFLSDYKNEKFAFTDKGGGAAEEGLDAVNIMTIHAAKGLEFPVVFLTDLSRAEPKGERRERSFLYSPSHNMYGLKMGGLYDPNMAFLRLEEAAHNRCEHVRLFYVALTRAKERLMICADAKVLPKTPMEYLFLSDLMPDDAGNFEETEILSSSVKAELRPYVKPEEIIYKYRRNTSYAKDGVTDMEAWRSVWEKRKETYKTISGSKYFISPSGDHAAAPRKQAESLAPLIGSICHKVLENINFGDFISEESVAKAASYFDYPEEMLSQAVPESFKILSSFTASPLCLELAKDKVLAKEMPFTFKEGDNIISGVIDLVMERGGEIWVMDYKTDTAADISKYSRQLSQYKAAVGKIFKMRAVKCGIIFLKHNEIKFIN
ncbi:ATP-dependent helicase/nuclease subunit A [Parelusimicrobium proximum]|uniref:UvrD-helicase domain-containing protein n=1 Tax=Parelusimicrobium proximum TaxID=3228953 RepID=UPI003D168F5D